MNASRSTKSQITLITSGERLVPILRTSIAAQAEKHLTALGVKVLKNTKVLSTSPETAGTASAHAAATKLRLSTCETFDADLYIPATGTRPNTSFLDPKLLDSDGRVTTNSHLRVPFAGPLTYALGDASSFARPAIHSITSAVPILCHNIRDDLPGVEGQDRGFKADEREPQMVLLGKRRAVGAAMGWWVPGWVVRLIKRDYWLWTTPKLWSGEQWARSS